MEKKMTCGGVLKKHRNKYLMIAPFFILFFTFVILPIISVVVLSFTSFNMLEFPKWIGASNYISLFVHDDVFLIAVKNTLLFAIITGPLSYLMCFFFAWIINNFNPKIRALLTLVFYAPSISGSAYLIWKLIFSSDMYGFANSALMSMGLIDSPILWFENPDYVMPVLIVVQLWLSLGVSFLSFIAGFQNVDKTLFEAGSVDGIRNRWQELWYLTLPMMKGQLLFGAVMQISSAFSVSTISEQLAGFPSVDYAGHTILTHLHDYGSVRFEMGYASAIAVVLFFIMVICNLLVQKLIRKL
mgnify:CR=1 FL=1